MIHLLALILLLAIPAQAEDAPVLPVPMPAEITLGTFPFAHPECKAWTNACALCRRDSDGKTVCSTSGIACTPVDIVCTDAKAP